MKKGIGFIITVALCTMLLTACGNSSGQLGNVNAQEPSQNNNAIQDQKPDNRDNGGAVDAEDIRREQQAVSQTLPEGNFVDLEQAAQIGTVTAGTEYEEDFLIDNILVFSDAGEYRSLNELHFHIYVPDSYDGSRPYALYITLPGYGAYYFQGVALNLRMERFAEEAKKYNEEVIIVAPQPDDWGETSKRQTIGLTEYMLAAYHIDPEKVYISGYSGGGETLSLAVSEKPELYTAALHVSSQWDGDLTKVVQAETPVYFVIGRNDEYYGSKPAKRAYEELAALYESAGVSEDGINRLVFLDIKERNYFSDRGVSNQHGGGALFAGDEMIMGWLFGEH